MTDKEFLSWIYDRMVHKHKEDKDADYMRKFRNIIDSLQKEHKPKFKIGQTIKFTGQYPIYPKVLTISEICNGQYWDKDGCIVPVRYQDDWELVKEPESEDLEEEIKDFFEERETWDSESQPSKEDIARHFANWQKQQDRKWLADNHKQIFNNGWSEGYEVGRDSMEEDMMKDAVEVDVKSDEDGLYTTETWEEMKTLLQKTGAKEGEKVYISIIKQEKE